MGGWGSRRGGVVVELNACCPVVVGKAEMIVKGDKWVGWEQRAAVQGRGYHEGGGVCGVCGGVVVGEVVVGAGWGQGGEA